MANAKFGANFDSIYPVVEPDMSDSGSLDNVLEFLVMAGNRWGDQKCFVQILPKSFVRKLVTQNS